MNKMRSKAKRRSVAQCAQAHPVARAVAREQMRLQMLDFSIEIYMHDDGAPAAVLLSDLGWILAVGAEVAANTEFASPLARRLHGALCTVLRLCEAGNRWRTEFAPALHLAAIEAQALIARHALTSAELCDTATGLAASIKAGTARPDWVAGPELYAAAVAAPPAQAQRAGTERNAAAAAQEATA